MNTYGEWAEIELQLFLQIIKPGDIVLDIGANIGAFTVPLANKVGNFGRVYAIEPQRIIFQRLNANIALNELSNVITLWSAVGNESGTVDVPLIDYTHEGNFAAVSLADPALYNSLATESVSLITLDTLKFQLPGQITGESSCPQFIKVDVELMEQAVLEGGRRLLARCRPVLHLENPCVMTSKPLIELLYELEYTPYWDVHSVYNRAQFEGVVDDIEPGVFAINVLAVPNHRLNSSDRDDAIVMVGYVQVERNKPYLHQYFDGTLTQAGDTSSCGASATEYVSE